MIEARELVVRYRGAREPALAGVSFTAAPGELLAIVGPNGSGKTTIVRALLGSVPLEGGTALIDGVEVSRWKRRELARVVAVLPQREDIVFPVTVRETVMLGRYAWLGPTAAPRGVDRAVVESALARCGVSALADRFVDGLSGGEWQRVRIARALAQEPRILILDEPTASLDLRYDIELFELTRGLVRGGMGAIVITHDLNLASRFADRVLLLDRGRVARTGVPAIVIEPELLSRVYGWPVEVTLWRGVPQVTPLRTVEAPGTSADI